MKKVLLKSLLTFTVIVALCGSCADDNQNEEVKDRMNQRVNEYVYTQMNTYYLWQEMMPDAVNFTNNPQRFFDHLVYSRDDKWSSITSNYQSLVENRAGRGKTYGYSVSLVRVDNDNNYAVVVNYVYDGSEAQRKGLKRGSIITTVDGEAIGTSNFSRLTSSDRVELTVLIQNGKTQQVVLENSEFEIDPVLINKTFEINAEKVGYLFLTQFQVDGSKKLEKHLQKLKSEGVKTLILDLRYNLGGNVSTAEFLCNSLAPHSVVKSAKIMVTKHWNKLMEQQLRESNLTNQLETRFSENGFNLDLTTLYVISSSSTASASELTIKALQPHMNVVVVGQQTAGKYVAGLLMHPQVQQPDGTSIPDPEIGNWAIQAMIYKFANANGETDFKSGITPDLAVADDVTSEFPLGDEHEPMLAKVLQAIAGTEISSRTPRLLMNKTNYTLIKTSLSGTDRFEGMANDDRILKDH